MKAQKVCEEIVNDLVREGFKFQVSKPDLEKAIMWRRGIDERTIKRWIKALETFGYLKRVTPRVWQLNPVKIPQLMTLLKEKPQTRVM